MNTRRIGLGAFTFIEIGILLVVLIGLNVLSCANPARLDLTEHREYTVSDATRKILANLDEIVNVRAYISDDLPPEYQLLRTEILDQLKTYDELDNGKLRLAIVEKPDPEKEQLEIKGIKPIEFRVQKEGEANVKRGYLGIYLERVNKNDFLPAVLSTETLEYDLMSAIVRLSKKESDTGKISVTQGNGEPDMEDPVGIKTFIASLREKKFTVYATTLDDKTEIPVTARTLLVMTPTKLTDFDKYQLDQFLMRGGNLLFMVDRFDLPAGEQGGPDFNAPPVPRTFAAADLLEFYGIRAEAKLVGDPSAEVVQYQNGNLINNHPYPFWIRVTNTNLSKANPAVSRLEMIDFPWASPLRILDDNIKQHPDVKVDVIAKTTPAAWALAPDDDEFKGLAPWNYSDFAAIRPDNEQYPLAVELTGTFKSFYEGKPDPIGERSVSEDRPRLDQSEKPGRVIVIGTGKWLTGPERAGWWAQFAPNQIFMFNLMDYLNLGDEMLGLRSRQVKVRPLAKQWISENRVNDRQLSPKNESTITLLNILLMPGLLALFAMASFAAKANRKRTYESRMRTELSLDAKLTAAERAEMAMEGAARGGFSLPLGSIIAMILACVGILGFVMWQLKTEQKQRQQVLSKQEAKLFPEFNKSNIEKFEIWEILGKYVFMKSGDQWQIGHVSYTPDKSEEERGAAMPGPNEFAVADSKAIQAVMDGIEGMQSGVLITENDVNAVQTYVGRIGSEYRMYNDKGKIVAKFVVGKNAEDFSGTYVQVRPPEQSENFPVYKVPGYLEPSFKKKSVLDWWDRKLFNLPSEAIQRVTVTRKGMPAITIEKAESGWQMVEPQGWTPDAATLSDWIDAVADLEVASWMDDMERYQLQQTPPAWEDADYTVSVWPTGAQEPIPPLHILLHSEASRGGSNIAKIGDGGLIFSLKDSDMKRLGATEADFQPGAPTAAAAEPPVEEPNDLATPLPGAE